jgi:mRNA export factor
MPVGEHQGPIKIIGWLEEMKMLVTGSWDKTIKYWDLRTNNPVGTLMLPERAYCADFSYPLAVICTAERHIGVIDLTKPDKFYRTFQSPLKYQSRSITCFPDKTGFALGSIEGRVAIHHVEEKDNVKNFAFKCHRENNGSEIYAVNALAFNKQFGTFATCGSDGSYHFWDKDSKTRLKAFQRCSLPVTSAAFNGDGTIFAYSIGYDWSKGAEYYNPNTMKNYILLHAVQEAEVKARGGQTGNNQQRRK